MVSYGKSQEAKMHQQNIMTISLAMIAMMGVACNGFSATPEDAARTFRTPSLELQVQPETGMFTLHTSRGSIPLLSHQTLEMPADNDAQNSKCTYEYQRSVTRSLQCLETSEKIILELTQDWPLFLVTKTLILSKQENPLILRYTLQAKQSVKLQKAMPVYCYFYAGQEMDRFAWETPTGLQTVTRNQERNRIFGTAARGAEHGRFAAFLKGAEGPGLLAAQPSKGTGQVFNLWRYEMPTKNRYLPGRVGFKSRLFEFKGELRKGELHVAEWQLASTTGSELKADVEAVRQSHARKRTEISTAPSRVTIPRVSEYPELDGVLDDRTWSRASHAGGLQLPHGGLPRNQTEVRLLLGEKHLYAAFVCHDENIGKLRRQYSNHDDPLWRDDAVEIFLAPTGGTGYKHYIFNSRGTRFEEAVDNWGEGQSAKDVNWDSAWKVETRVHAEEGRWTAEVAIPLTDVAPSDGQPLDGLRLNIGRSHRMEGSTIWSPTYGGFHNIHRFGEAPVANEGVTLEILSLTESPEWCCCELRIANPGASTREIVLLVTPCDVREQEGASFEQIVSLAPGQKKILEIPFRYLLKNQLKNTLKILLFEDDAPLVVREFPLTQVFGKREHVGRCYSSPVTGQQIWTFNTDYKIFQQDRLLPVPDDSTPLRLEMARGENRAFQVVLAPDEYREIQLQPTALQGQKGDLSADHVAVRRVGYVTTTTISDSAGFTGDWPDPLLPTSDAVVKPDSNQAMWVTVSVPRDAAPGLYRGDIDVKENDKIILSVPYEVNVRKFSLPERFSQAFLAPDPGLLRETYGMDTGFKFECRPKLVKGEIVIPEFATPGFQRRIEKCRSLNLRYITMCSFHVGSGPGPGPFLGAEPGTEEYFRLVREYLQKVYDKFKQHELHHNLRFYVYDEPTLKELPLIKEVAKVVRGIDPEILIYGAIYINSWKAMDEEARMLIDGWWTGYGSYTPEFLRWARAHNKTVMAGFNCGSRHPFPSLFIDHPALSPRVISWINWKYGIDIITTWHTYHTVHSPDPYINPATFSHYNGDGVLIYPSGPNKRKPWNVPSIRLELLREGMADYEYFKILASLIEAAPPGPGREQAAETLRLAESLVTDARTFCREPEPYRRTRRQMADAIEQLHKHNASTVTEYDKP